MLLPVFKFLTGTSVLVFLALSDSIVKSLLDFLGPLVENPLEVSDHIIIDLLAVVDVEGILGVFGVIGLKYDVVGEGKNCFTDLLGEAVESLHELLLLVRFTAAPIGSFELIYKGLVDTVDHCVKSEHGVLIDLSEQHFVIVRATLSDWLTGGRASHKVDTLAFKLEFFTVGDVELLTAVRGFNTFVLVVKFIRFLVINVDVSNSCTFEPGFKNWLVSHIGK